MLSHTFRALRSGEYLGLSAALTGLLAHGQCPTLGVSNGAVDRANHGWVVVDVGDVNADGVHDFAVSEISNGERARDAGKVCVYSGAAPDQLIYSFFGEAAHDWFGWSVAPAGDVDHDGHADIIVGALRNDAGGSEAGRVYVFSGVDGFRLWTFTGTRGGAEFGRTVGPAGDVDKDGFDDVFVGAPHDQSSSVYIYSGWDGRLLQTLTSGSVDGFGHSVANVGDVNVDGWDELLIGVPFRHGAFDQSGAAALVDGKRFSVSRVWFGSSDHGHFGLAVAAGGDVNADGTPDFIISEPGFDTPHFTDTGRTHVLDGRTGSTEWRFTGGGGGFGASITGRLDIDRDGAHDVAIGAPTRDRVYVFSGLDEAAAEVFSLAGERNGTLYGHAISSIADVSSDKLPDLLIGSPNFYESDPAYRPGRAYLVQGGQCRSYRVHVDSLIAGAKARIVISGATPNTLQALVYSSAGVGLTAVPQLEGSLDLHDPVLVGTAISDDQGTVEMHALVPIDARGAQIWIQGIEHGRASTIVTAVVQE